MSKQAQPSIIPESEHRISPGDISDQALKVLDQLRRGGFDAFLVGGCVRDLMLGREPKDFDVATNAHPEEVRSLIKNCRLIGRRFRLAHVYFGRNIIEVATYRAPAQDSEEEDRQQTDSGRILRDNVYGTIEQDAVRRDFTINALYYDAADHTVRDFVAGVSDLRQGVIRLIGDPEVRYREDPVRMLRAVRFAAKLGLKIEPGTAAPIRELGPLLEDVPPARLFEEVLKLFHGGMALETFEMLRHYDLFRFLFPMTESILSTEEHGFPHILIPRALANTDERINAGKPVTPAFLLAVLLWEPARQQAEKLVAGGTPPQEALRIAAGDILREQAAVTSMQRRFTTMLREIWFLQATLENRTRRRVLRVIAHERFRASYDFLCLRAAAGEVDPALCEWWTRYQEVDHAGQQAMLQELPGSTGRKKRRRRKKRKPAGDA